MELDEAKNKFIEAWGTLGTAWGINRAMSQIHALLLISVKPLNTEEIMAELQISRGNVNMNVRALMEWGLVSKHLTPGDRKEYFSAMKDVAAIGRLIAKERRKREVQPVLAVLSDVKNISGNGEQEVVFKEFIADLEDFTSRVDRTLEKFIQSDENWFYKQLMSLI